MSLLVGDELLERRPPSEVTAVVGAGRFARRWPSPTAAAGTRGAARPKPWLVGAVLALLAASVGAWWVTRHPDPVAMGDRGQVLAQVSAGCASLEIVSGGLRLMAINGASQQPAIPSVWRGRPILGRLELQRRSTEGVVWGTFTTEAGTRIRVIGARAGQIRPPATCRAWT